MNGLSIGAGEGICYLSLPLCQDHLPQALPATDQPVRLGYGPVLNPPT